jgi:hypothetical protein
MESACTYSLAQNIDPLNEDQYHLNAVDKMIKVRGGLDKLRYNPFIVDLFLWCRQTRGNFSLCLGHLPDV